MGKRVKKQKHNFIWYFLRLFALALAAGLLSTQSGKWIAPAELPILPGLVVTSPVEAVPMAVTPMAAPEERPAESCIFAAETDRVKHAGPSGKVEETQAVTDIYFENVVFVGDSRTEGLYLYGNMSRAEYLYAMGATVESVFTRCDWGGDEEKIPLLDALRETRRNKIYLMLGVNELGWPETDIFRQRYTALLERVRADHPEADIVIQSILPVSAKQHNKGTYVNNDRIKAYNAVLLELAEELRYPYVDVAEAVRGEDGCLRAELTYDGVHLNKTGCRIWLDYLRTHRV